MSLNGVLPLNGTAAWKTDPAEFARRVSDGMGDAVQLAIADHHRCGFSVAIWRDGRVVMLHPDGSTTPVPVPVEEPVQPAQP